MSLIEIKQYIQVNKRVTLSELANVFHQDPTYVQALLHHLLAKGMIQKKLLSERCAQCHGCDLDAMIWYEWIN